MDFYRNEYRFFIAHHLITDEISMFDLESAVSCVQWHFTVVVDYTMEGNAPSTLGRSSDRLQVCTVTKCVLKPPNHPPLPKYNGGTCQARHRFARGLRPSRRTRSRSHLRRATQCPCRARCPTVGGLSLSSRPRLDGEASPGSGAGSGSGAVEIEFDVQKAHSCAHASAVPTTTRPRGYRGCKCWSGRGGRRGVAAGSASAAMPVRKGRSNAASLTRPSAWRRAEFGEAHELPVRSS
jgi:hypothetical protein